MGNRNSEKQIRAQQGFTLIELSIVLVIIGLIVGGVLVGQDLIRAAEIRATISQIEKYNTAVNTFRNKYNGIPGDLAQAQASSFGLFTLTDSTTLGQGDGNGLIEGGASGVVTFVGEVPVFWRHLSDGGYVDGSFGNSPNTITASSGVPTATSSTVPVNGYVPAAKLGRGNVVTIGSTGGYNYFIIAGITSISGTGYFGTANNYMTPQEAYNIDKKTDDGLPASGSINALDATLTSGGLSSTTAPAIATLAAAGNCVTSATPAAYNLTGTFGSTQNCSLRLRFN